MTKYFTAAAFEPTAEAFQFQSANSNANSTTAAATKVSKSKKKRNKKKQKSEQKQNVAPLQQGKGPLAPPPFSDSDDDDMQPKAKSKIQKGRIEKKKVVQKSQQKLKMSAAMSKAVNEASKNAKQKTATAAVEMMEQDEVVQPTAATGLAAKLKEQLMGGRFRFLNEQLYTMNSKKAEQLFEQDKDAFEAYHAGYRHQVAKWPLNPLQRIAKMLRRLPRSLEIADFGCGEGKLAQLLPHRVTSMDLVACRPDIIACNMDNTPLSSGTLDVAVYCLSLMGTNLTDYFLECNRVLKVGGLVYIAEIQSRFEDVRAFIKTWEACGFELVRKDVDVKLFYFFQFKKLRNVGKVAKLPNFALKPCLYRKR